MSEKILVSVKLPATRKSYDFWVPSDMSIHDAAGLISTLLEGREGDRFKANDGNALMLAYTGDLLDPNSTMGGNGLVNGSRLALV